MELKTRFLDKFSHEERYENDPEFTCWVSSKFRDAEKLSISLKIELWTYWFKRNDEEELTEEVAEFFRIKINLFDYETPLCKEFNYLLKIDDDILTGDLPGFKTSKEFKNT